MSGQVTIKVATEPHEIEATFDVVRQLRPHLRAEDYVTTVNRLMQDGFRLAALTDEGGVVRAVAGYRFGESLAWGRYLYVDDLVTDESSRSRGSGGLLLRWLKEEATRAGCRELHLDSGVQRHGAHRFYLRERMDIVAYHFKLDLP